MEYRVHGKLYAVASPIGYLPLHGNLRKLFDAHLGKDPQAHATGF
jgi:hypothetical protein